jgi:hypothetical protein
MSEETENQSTDLENYEMYLDTLDIRIFKLSSGEEIIAFVESETKDKMILDNPMKIVQTYYAIDRWPLESEIAYEKEQLENEFEQEVDPEFEDFANRMEAKVPDDREKQSQEYYSNDYKHQDMQKDYIYSESNRKRIISTEHFVDWIPYAASSVMTINTQFVMSEILPTTFFKHLYLEATNELMDDQDRSIEENENLKETSQELEGMSPITFVNNKNVVH